MLNINTPRKATKSARALAKFIRGFGVSLTHNQALDGLGVMAGFQNWAGFKGLLAQVPPVSIPSIGEMDPQQLSTVVIDDSPYFVNFVDMDGWAKVLQWGELDDRDYEESLVAVHLGCNVDGFVEQRDLTVSWFRSLTWNQAKSTFVTPDGAVVQFLMATPFGQAAPAVRTAPELTLVYECNMTDHFEYDVPSEVPEWAWIEQMAAFAHRRNGHDGGVWEHMVYVTKGDEESQCPPALKPILDAAVAQGCAWVLFSQGT